MEIASSIVQYFVLFVQYAQYTLDHLSSLSACCIWCKSSFESILIKLNEEEITF